ncbi:Autophagy-related protein [Trichinella spiralis]|uniref:Autophagy-related protein n=1 Tax=Trichinella spiralis TaxID=6334 RepID=A0ABR3K8B9_TRISP
MTGCSIWPACCKHPALDPSRYVAALSLNDRFHLYPQRAYYLLVGIPYVQFYGAFIVQCPRRHLRQQRQQKMKKSDLSKSPAHSFLSRKQPITTSQNVADGRNTASRTG